LKKQAILILLFTLLVSFELWGEIQNPEVKIETSKGMIVVILNQDSAPKTVANFLKYVKEGYYNNTVFHRVIKGFMVQGGGLTAELNRKPTHDPVINEADNGLKNSLGTLSMARTRDPHSATAQFFINTANNKSLDHRGKNQQGWGYCVFGKVIKGIDIVKKIENVQTGYQNRRQDVPIDPVLIKKITLIQK